MALSPDQDRIITEISDAFTADNTAVDNAQSALKAAQTYADELTTDLAEMQTRAENAEASLAGSESARLALQAEYDEYRRTHTQPDPPPPPVFRFSVTVGANDARNGSWGVSGGTPQALQKSIDVATFALGRGLGELLKCFGNNGVNDALNMWHGVNPVGVNPLLTSEPFDQAGLNALMDALTVPVDFCHIQEFHRKIGGTGQITYDTFNGRYADLRTQIDAHPNGHLVHLRYVGAESTERTAGYTLYKKVVVQPRCGVGNDTYISVNKYLDPALAYKGSVDWFNYIKGTVEGGTLNISETGVNRNFPTATRVKFVQDASAYIESVDPNGSLTYWATKNADADWSLDQPGDELFASAVAALIRN